MQFHLQPPCKFAGRIFHFYCTGKILISISNSSLYWSLKSWIPTSSFYLLAAVKVLFPHSIKFTPQITLLGRFNYTKYQALVFTPTSEQMGRWFFKWAPPSPLVVHITCAPLYIIRMREARAIITSFPPQLRRTATNCKTLQRNRYKSCDALWCHAPSFVALHLSKWPISREVN